MRSLLACTTLPDTARCQLTPLRFPYYCPLLFLRTKTVLVFGVPPVCTLPFEVTVHTFQRDLDEAVPPPRPVFYLHLFVENIEAGRRS